MQTITVREGQTLLDVAMQYCGDATQAFAIAFAEGKSLTDDLTVLSTVKNVPDADVSKQRVVNEFKDNGLIPASSVTVDESFEGIGFWYIKQDFQVTND